MKIVAGKKIQFIFYVLYMGYFRPNRPGFTFFSHVKYVIDMATTNDLHEFSDYFFENFFGSNRQDCRFGTKGRYGFF